MLPSARSYLHQGGLSPQAAAYAVIGCFLGGVIGIQFVSRVLHHYIPSDVVDCDHSHDEPSDDCPDQQGSSHESRAKKQFDEQSPLLAKHKQQVNPTGLQRSVSASGALAHQSLQTSIAIALHKLPEGFITFATNHANPKLGFAVFMALFIHNITEGFAMALPLYLAIGSRLKSMFWSSLLGGASQPLGAGMAALWFKMARTSDKAPGETLYGCMFALTGGIMAAVALQLFAESLALNHNRNLCMTFAFVGMGILGTSFALTAG
ncbi:MAG: hypothetical protein LQ348_001228 [Seirophora lacunosa]|nr:MAG: hypothetical protein LQ348_001228 [Seirophora lacunosa]